MFSIVMPLYNKAAYLRDTIDSVLAQSEADFELLVVDDGSTDEGPVLIEERSDPRIRLIRQDNAGPGAARNKGMAASSRPWIAMQDADDLWHRDHLRVLRNVIEGFRDAEMITTRSSVWRGQDLAEEAAPCATRYVSYLNDAANLPGTFSMNNVAFSSCLTRRIAPMASWRVGEDIEYLVRAALESRQAINMQVTAYYNQNPSSLSMQVTAGVSRRGPVPSLREFTPVAATLSQWLLDHPQNEQRKAVKRYLDWRIVIGIKAAIIRREYARACSLLRLLSSPSRAFLAEIDRQVARRVRRRPR